MSHHLVRQIGKLKTMIVSLGDLVEKSVRDAIEAIDRRDTDLAHQVIEGDKEIDSLEIDVEEECLHTLALYQPVAMDLRYVVAVLKMNHDLERIGDQAVNIAEQAEFLSSEAPLAGQSFDLMKMAEVTQRMLRQSLQALVENDVELAQKVRASDDQVDRMNREMYDRVEDAIRNLPAQTSQLIHVLNVSRQLERIADHATNIAEDVIYTVQGEIPRHGANASHLKRERT